MNMDHNESSLNSELSAIIQAGFENAANGLERMIGVEIAIGSPSVKSVPINQIANVVGGPEMDAVGIYLRLEGDLEGQVMLIFPYEKALELVDLMLERERGESQVLGSMERSALAEIGNLTGTFFVNAMDEILGLGGRPSPPAVMVDMLGSILDVILATMGAFGQDVLMFTTCFYVGERTASSDFWIIPDPSTLKKLYDASKGINA